MGPKYNHSWPYKREAQGIGYRPKEGQCEPDGELERGPESLNAGGSWELEEAGNRLSAALLTP